MLRVYTCSATKLFDQHKSITSENNWRHLTRCRHTSYMSVLSPWTKWCYVWWTPLLFLTLAKGFIPDLAAPHLFSHVQIITAQFFPIPHSSIPLLHLANVPKPSKSLSLLVLFLLDASGPFHLSFSLSLRPLTRFLWCLQSPSGFSFSLPLLCHLHRLHSSDLQLPLSWSILLDPGPNSGNDWLNSGKSWPWKHLIPGKSFNLSLMEVFTVSKPSSSFFVKWFLSNQFWCVLQFVDQIRGQTLHLYKRILASLIGNWRIAKMCAERARWSALGSSGSSKSRRFSEMICKWSTRGNKIGHLVHLLLNDVILHVDCVDDVLDQSRIGTNDSWSWERRTVRISTRNPKRSAKYIYHTGTSASSTARAGTSCEKVQRKKKFIQYTMDLLSFPYCI